MSSSCNPLLRNVSSVGPPNVNSISTGDVDLVVGGASEGEVVAAELVGIAVEVEETEVVVVVSSGSGVKGIPDPEPDTIIPEPEVSSGCKGASLTTPE